MLGEWPPLHRDSSTRKCIQCSSNLEESNKLGIHNQEILELRCEKPVWREAGVVSCQMDAASPCHGQVKILPYIELYCFYRGDWFCVISPQAQDISTWRFGSVRIAISWICKWGTETSVLLIQLIRLSSVHSLSRLHFLATVQGHLLGSTFYRNSCSCDRCGRRSWCCFGCPLVLFSQVYGFSSITSFPCN